MSQNNFFFQKLVTKQEIFNDTEAKVSREKFGV